MKIPTRAQQRAYVEQWKRAGPELQSIRDEELRNWKYDYRIADALLDMGHRFRGPPRETSGLVEMQAVFMKGARRMGLLPAAVRELPAPYGRQDLFVNGDAALLDRPLVALFCSVNGPGKLILETYDLARRFRREGVGVVSGFHSPMERECLRILLRGAGPVVWCLARGMLKRVPAQPPECRRALAEGRLALVTPFRPAVRRITAGTATRRNQLVARMAGSIFIAHAAPGSKIARLAGEWLDDGRPVFLFEHPDHATWFERGARPAAELGRVGA